jgi:hypothetical protein
MKEMRKMLGVCLLVGLFAVLAGPARAETWCIRDAGSPPPGACVFPSSHECGMAARMNPFGGICERQPLGYETGDKGTSSRRSAKRKAADR